MSFKTLDQVRKEFVDSKLKNQTLTNDQHHMIECAFMCSAWELIGLLREEDDSQISRESFNKYLSDIKEHTELLINNLRLRFNQ
jgi:hypothetical protein